MHFKAQNNDAAINAYKEGIAILPARKPEPPSKHSTDGGKGKGRQDSDSEGDDDDTDSKVKSVNENEDSQIREIVDDEDEKAFVEQGKISDEEKQVIELRSALWNNLAACQLRLVS